jgi:hypothetical protein
MNHTPSPDFNVEDLDFMSAKQLRTTRNFRKLYWKQMVPFPIKRVISPYAHELDLPSSMKILPVRHVFLLEIAPNNPSQGQKKPPPPPVIIDEMEEYAIDEVLNSRLHRKEPQYLIWRVGYPYPSWEPNSFHQETTIITTYYEQHTWKPGPWYDEEGQEV